MVVAPAPSLVPRPRPPKEDKGLVTVERFIGVQQSLESHAHTPHVACARYPPAIARSLHVIKSRATVMRSDLIGLPKTKTAQPRNRSTVTRLLGRAGSGNETTPPLDPLQRRYDTVTSHTCSRSSECNQKYCVHMLVYWRSLTFS